MASAKSNILNNAAKATFFNIILQVALRVSTFVANAVIVRYSNKNLLGIMNVRLMLLYTTCQFFSREATRRACISDSKLYKWNVSVNCIWLNIPILFFVGNILAFVWTNVLQLPEQQDLISAYQYSVYLIVVSVLVELLVEPFYIYGHLNGFVKSNVLIEGFAQMFRTFGMVLIVFFENQDAEILKQFASLHLLSSIGYSLIYFLVFFYHFSFKTFKKEDSVGLNDFIPSFRNIQDTFKLLTIVRTFFVQTAFKQILTEGERFVMTFFNLLSFSDQGIYNAINNLSSLAARFIFAPIENNSYLVFSQFIDRNKSFDKQSIKDLQVVDRVLRQLLKLMVLLGMIIVFFGYNYSELVLLIYGGRKFASEEAVALMKWQCFYVAIIAINGVTETFTFASMSKDELNKFNYLMAVLSIVFLGSNFVFVSLIGLPGFVLSSCIQMLGRIAYSFYLIGKDFKKISISIKLGDLLPNRVIIGYLLSVFTSLMILNSILKLNAIIFIIIGGLQMLLLALLIYRKENELVRFFIHELKQIKTD